ncbi:MAG: NAD-dependent epimerase/dehydratase family protein [Candidatus Omnitrophota bacterium]
MKVLVTGGAGFIGSYIADELIRRGHTVRIFDSLDPQVHPNGERPVYLNPKAEFVYGDVRDIGAFRQALADQEIVFHEAAAVGMGQSMYKVKHYVDVNVGGTANLLDLLANEKHSVKKVIVAASQSSYGEGCCLCPRRGVIKADFRSEEQLKAGRWEYLSPEGEVMEPSATPESAPRDCQAIYALNKRDQEDMLLSIGQTYGIPAVALRYYNVYGPRQSLSNPYTGVLAIFMSRLANGKPPVIYEDGLQSRDFISVHDVVQGNMLAMENDKANGQAFNLGTGIPTSIKDIALMLAKTYGVSIEPEITGKYRKGDTRHCFADITKIKTMLGFEPKVSLQEGMRELVEWSRSTDARDLFDQAAKELAEKGLA